MKWVPRPLYLVIILARANAYSCASATLHLSGTVCVTLSVIHFAPASLHFMGLTKLSMVNFFAVMCSFKCLELYCLQYFDVRRFLRLSSVLIRGSVNSLWQSIIQKGFSSHHASCKSILYCIPKTSEVPSLFTRNTSHA